MLNIKHYKQSLTRRMILADRNARGLLISNAFCKGR